MPLKTIDCPEQLRPYLPWLLRFLRREIPLTADLLWSIDIYPDRLLLRTDHPTGAVENTSFMVRLDPQTAAKLNDFLHRKPITMGDMTITLERSQLVHSLHSTQHRGSRLSVPEISIDLPGMPDPILTAIEATDTDLLLHLRFRLTHAPFTVAVI